MIHVSVDLSSALHVGHTINVQRQNVSATNCSYNEAAFIMLWSVFI